MAIHNGLFFLANAKGSLKCYISQTTDVYTFAICLSSLLQGLEQDLFVQRLFCIGDQVVIDYSMCPLYLNLNWTSSSVTVRKFSVSLPKFGFLCTLQIPPPSQS